MDCSCAVNIKYLATEAEVEIEAPICPTPRNSVNSTRPAHTDADGEEGTHHLERRYLVGGPTAVFLAED